MNNEDKKFAESSGQAGEVGGWKYDEKIQVKVRQFASREPGRRIH